MAKYNVKDAAFDPVHEVLKNKLAITDPEKLQSEERDCLLKAYSKAALNYSEEHVFTEKDIRALHNLFLGDLYEWAGTYRTVDLSSKDIRYCHAAFIDSHIKSFSKELAKMTPFSPNLSRGEILTRLAKIHGELIIIHPFRDGNGRLTRLLCDLLLGQAEYVPMKISEFYNEDFVRRYHKAIQEMWRTLDHSQLVRLFDPLVSKHF